jgi:hypothetical protein
MARLVKGLPRLARLNFVLFSLGILTTVISAFALGLGYLAEPKTPIIGSEYFPALLCGIGVLVASLIVEIVLRVYRDRGGVSPPAHR